jgi:phenylpropionate dioxygenase-like ring-hydroxylating dioxygenase large terminal subunit
VIADSDIDLQPLRRYWHPVADAGDVDEAPLCVQLLDEQVVLFRSGGSVRAFRDLCPHRGAKISMGSVVDGTLVCPYHGFRYDGSGSCVYIPSQPRDLQRIPARLKLAPYHVEERYGLVWVALEEPVAPLPAFPQYDHPEFMDPARRRPPRHDGSLRVRLHVPVHAAARHPRRRRADDPLHDDAADQCRSLLDVGAVRAQPLVRPSGLDWISFSETIWDQDQAITEQQHPEMLPVDLTEEVHLRVADAPGIALRRLLRETGMAYA